MSNLRSQLRLNSRDASSTPPRAAIAAMPPPKEALELQR
jgi:hypothetical protein